MPLAGLGAIKRLILMLCRGRIDTVLEDENVANYWLRKLNLSSEISHAGVLSSEKVYIAFSPVDRNSYYYAKIFSEGVKQLRENGKLKKILSSYGIFPRGTGQKLGSQKKWRSEFLTKACAT